MLVQTCDGFTFLVPNSVVEKCKTLDHASEVAHASEGTINPVPVPNVTATLMSRVVQYFSIAPSEMYATHAFFHDMDRRDLFGLMEAASYLNATELLDDACNYIADLIRNKSPEQIRDILHIRRDVSDEEAARLAAKFAWAIK